MQRMCERSCSVQVEVQTSIELSGHGEAPMRTHWRSRMKPPRSAAADGSAISNSCVGGLSALLWWPSPIVCSSAQRASSSGSA